MRKLSVLNWALRTPEGRLRLMSATDRERPLQDLIVRFDVGLTRAVDLAVGSRLIVVSSNGSVALTTTGVELADSILNEGECFRTEIEYLQNIKTRLREADVERITKGTLK
jgi:hypothetical protein